MRFAFRPLTDDDLPVLVRWQSSPAALPWFDPVPSVEEARVRYGPRISGTHPARMFVVQWHSADGVREIGYAQCYRIGELTNDTALDYGAPPGAVGIDYVIGEDDLIGRGVGTAMIAAFVAQIVRSTYPDVRHVVAAPDHRNIASRKALGHNGFVEGLWVDEPGTGAGHRDTVVVCTLDLQSSARRTDYCAGMTRVAVIGAKGRMGAAVCQAVEEAEGLTLVAAYDAGDELGELGGADVAVEFSVPSAAPANVAHCIARGVHVVVGTTGWDDAALEALRAQLAEAPPSRNGASVGVLIAPNFSIGAILMMSFAAHAARWFESVEVIELHHPDKVDAPSGTAARTARLIADARAQAGCAELPDATVNDPYGARGATIDGIPVHSVRLRGLVAHQEVLLGGVGEQLMIRHDSFDRSSFMPGVVEGIRRVGDHPGLTVGLENYLPS